LTLLATRCLQLTVREGSSRGQIFPLGRRKAEIRVAQLPTTLAAFPGSEKKRRSPESGKLVASSRRVFLLLFIRLQRRLNLEPPSISRFCLLQLRTSSSSGHHDGQCRWAIRPSRRHAGPRHASRRASRHGPGTSTRPWRSSADACHGRRASARSRRPDDGYAAERGARPKCTCSLAPKPRCEPAAIPPAAATDASSL
jgi:hypothetical protein